MFGSLLGTLQSTSVFGSLARSMALGGPQTQAVRGMAKLKTHKGAAKRWKPLAKGMFQRSQTGLRHLNRRLAPDVRRGKHATVQCSDGQKRHLEHLLPYSIKH
ncbi:hypothetical protein GGI07_004769 [Coemansia sp. Benny D115]|nr:hypothetical protein GGI07_004769 [Coemansia sp. Benny D115]